MSFLRGVLFLLLVGGVLGCGADATSSSPTAPTAPPVQVGPAEARTTALPVHTSGRLATKAEIQLGFKISGVIDRIQVDEGDTVAKGERLAQLNLSEINAQVREARAALEQARMDLERTRRLYRDSVATEDELENARTGVERAEANLDGAQFNLDYATIEAPEAGRILARRAEEGELVQGGTPILTLGATGRGWVVRTGLAARDVVRVQLGDSASVVFDAYPERSFSAQVAEIADRGTPRTGTFEVELSVPDPQRLLKSGFIGRVTLHPSTRGNFVVIPPTALVDGDGRQGAVFRYDDATRRVQRTPVRIAEVLDNAVALSSGLSAGTPVVTSGANALADGDSVRVVRDE